MHSVDFMCCYSEKLFVMNRSSITSLWIKRFHTLSDINLLNDKMYYS